MLKANRELDKLKPSFKEKVEMFLEEAGDRVFITEAWRSDERQAELYARGRTAPWNIITWTLNSKHQDWEAIDIAFFGKSLYPSDEYKWKEIAEIAERFWLDWWQDL